PTRARLPLLSWDTEGGGQAQKNLLRTGSAAGLRVKLNGQWRGGEEFPTQLERIGGAEILYHLALAPETVLEWRLRSNAGALKMTLGLTGRAPSHLEGIELLFPFDPRVAATTLLP